MTDRVLKNVIGKVGGPEGIQGFDGLEDDDKVHLVSTCSVVHMFMRSSKPSHMFRSAACFIVHCQVRKPPASSWSEVLA